ncbi:hypothetical protein AVEN_156328-1 [Araneus ventricosus]|uniref:Uncharacterized protein n=1 Tax=Araneus ventricosus TaxID=182803 RepID=A0A4Y2L4L8_ARAVE|nr:hypothetical protein AVEN_156328-1 [Araneus ventricosus]
MASNKRSIDVLFDEDDFSDSEPCGPLTQDFFQSSQHFRDLPSQLGCGMESAPNTSTHALDIEEENIDSSRNPSVDPDNEIICRQDLDECISIREKSRRVNRRYQAQEIILEVEIEIDRLPESMSRKALCNIWPTLRLMFEMIIKRASEDLDPADLMRFCIFSSNLDKPISTCLWRVHTFTADKVLNAIANAIESNEELQLDETLRMEITTIRQPVGAGRIRKVVNVECDRLNKRSILCIPTDSLGLCCAKAVVFAIAHLDGDRRSINAMKDRRRPASETRARELHKKAGIPLGPCTFAEVARFEEVLDIQIVVISTEERNGASKKNLLVLITLLYEYVSLKNLKISYINN